MNHHCIVGMRVYVCETLNVTAAATWRLLALRFGCNIGDLQLFSKKIFHLTFTAAN